MSQHPRTEGRALRPQEISTEGTDRSGNHTVRIRLPSVVKDDCKFSLCLYISVRGSAELCGLANLHVRILIDI